MGLAMRMSKSTRHIPIVFAGGVAEKVAGVRTLLPDAAYAPWAKIGGVVKRAMVRGVRDPVVPRSIFETYSGTPLPKKLCVKAHSSLALVRDPHRFSPTPWPLP